MVREAIGFPSPVSISFSSSLPNQLPTRFKSGRFGRWLALGFVALAMAFATDDTIGYPDREGVTSDADEESLLHLYMAFSLVTSPGEKAVRWPIVFDEDSCVLCCGLLLRLGSKSGVVLLL